MKHRAGCIMHWHFMIAFNGVYRYRPWRPDANPKVLVTLSWKHLLQTHGHSRAEYLSKRQMENLKTRDIFWNSADSYLSDSLYRFMADMHQPIRTRPSHHLTSIGEEEQWLLGFNQTAQHMIIGLFPGWEKILINSYLAVLCERRD